MLTQVVWLRMEKAETWLGARVKEVLETWSVQSLRAGSEETVAVRIAWVRALMTKRYQTMTVPRMTVLTSKSHKRRRMKKRKRKTSGTKHSAQRSKRHWKPVRSQWMKRKVKIQARLLKRKKRLNLRCSFRRHWAPKHSTKDRWLKMTFWRFLKTTTSR